MKCLTSLYCIEHLFSQYFNYAEINQRKIIQSHCLHLLSLLADLVGLKAIIIDDYYRTKRREKNVESIQNYYESLLSMRNSEINTKCNNFHRKTSHCRVNNNKSENVDI